MAATLSSGIRSPHASVRPTSRAIDSATSWWSPDSMIARRMPTSWSAAIAARAAGRGVSMSPRAPRNRVVVLDDHDGAARGLQRLDGGHDVGRDPAVVVEQSDVADQHIGAVDGRADAPTGDRAHALGGGRCPAIEAFGAVADDRRGERMVAPGLDRHCDRQQLRLSDPIGGRDVGERGRPSVSVPVLSNAIARSVPRFSSGPPPFTSTPSCPARATAASTALGVAIASAHGLAATSTAIAR